MKDSTSHSPDLTHPDLELCCQKKCVTCFELGGCIFERYPIVSVYHNAESNAKHQIDSCSTISSPGSKLMSKTSLFLIPVVYVKPQPDVLNV